VCVVVLESKYGVLGRNSWWVVEEASEGLSKLRRSRQKEKERDRERERQRERQRKTERDRKREERAKTIENLSVPTDFE